MKGVTFGTHHSSDYGLILSRKYIESPKPKLEIIDLPGADGVLDMTDYFGDVKYENRELKFEFSTGVRGRELLELYSRVQDDLNGRRFESIVIDDDPLYHYTGRVTSISLTEGAISTLTVECSCEPYKTRTDMREIGIQLRGLGFGSRYGDCNGDGIIDTLDAAYLMKAIENNTANDLNACDLNFDKVVDNEDLLFLNRFLAQSQYKDIREYAESLSFYRDTEVTVDFGRNVINAIFAINHNWGYTDNWELYLDGVLYYRGTHRLASCLVSGKHKVTFRTAKNGRATINFSESRL